MTILHKSDTINGHEFAYAVRTTSDGIDIELISGVTSLEFADEAFISSNLMYVLVMRM